MIQGTGPVLVVAAHADDEVLGAAGTIARSTSEGRSVHVVVLSCSVVSRRLSPDAARTTRDARRRDARSAASALGATVELHDLPDNHFDTVPGVEVSEIIEASVRAHRPTLVLTHWSHDLSSDHQIAARSTLVACRPTPDSTVESILAYEVRSSTDWTPARATTQFEPSVFVELDSAAWNAKARALHCYGSELRDAPHTRSFEGIDVLSRHRGMQVGCHRAEAFVLLRSVLRS